MPMTLPNGVQYTVEVAFPSSASWGNNFILDDPVRGKLNDTTYTLGGVTWADVTADVVSVEISRGRSTETDVFQAGSASIVMRNDSRQYDPLNTAGTYYGGIVPRLPVRVTASNERIFSGYLYDMNFEYAPPTGGRDVSRMLLSCVDAFSLLGEQFLTAFTPTSQLSGARVTAVLDRSEVSFPATRDIRTGSSTLGTQLVAAQTNVLDYLQQVAASEQGFLFVAGNGSLTFLGRNDIVSTLASMTFSDDGTGTPYQSFSVGYGAELLFNRVVVTRSGGSTYTATDSASISQYLTKTLTLDDLLVSSDTQAQDIGTNLLGLYSEPRLRFSEISTIIESTDPKFMNVLGLELGDIVDVKKSYLTGSPSSVTRTCFVQGLNHRITPATHEVTLELGSVDSRAFLRLDNTVFGVLDSNRLGF